MRKAFARQRRFDCSAIENIQLNLECRDEMIPILRALQEIYSQPHLRDGVLKLIEDDVLRRDDGSRACHDTGRERYSYWQILVLAAVRLGSNLDNDTLQDLAEIVPISTPWPNLSIILSVFLGLIRCRVRLRKSKIGVSGSVGGEDGKMEEEGRQ